MADKKKDTKVEGGYIIRAEVRRKDGTVIRPKKAKALKIPIAALKNFKG